MTERLSPKRSIPPWPKPLPYTSNILRRLARGWKSWFGLLNEWDFRIPLGELNLLGLPVFLVNSPPLIRKVLVEEVDQFPKHPYTLWILEPLIGRAIFSVNGEEWQWQRRLIDQAFQVAELKRVFPAMSDATKALLDRLELQKDNPYIDIDKEMTLVTADVIMRTILSRPLGGGEAIKIFEAFARYQRRAGRALVLRFLRLPKTWVQKSLQKDANIIREWILKAIEDRLEQHSRNPPSHLNPVDLLDCLITSQDQQTHRSFSKEELVDQICFLFLAGHETSASSLGMASWLLAFSPKDQQRVREEVKEISKDRQPNEMLRADDLRHLKYCVAVFNETLRLYPPVGFFIRERSQSETTLSVPNGEKRRCPLGALLTLSPWVIQRHENHWPDPQAFRPDRFLEDKERTWMRDAFLPFGLGPRKCPGAAFAQQEAILVLAELVRRYNLSLISGHTPELMSRLTLRSVNGINLLLQKAD